ncbi:13655_t:CDS:2, partial [Gigaspora margarita]
PTVDVNRVQAMLAQLLSGEDAFNSIIIPSDYIFETFAAKKRKKNDSEAEEVKTLELNKKENDNHMYKIKREITRIMRAGKVVTTKMAEYCLKVDKEEKTTSIYFSANFLKEVDIAIDYPSIVVIIGVHREQKNYAVIVRTDCMKKARARLDWEKWRNKKKGKELEEEVDMSEEKTGSEIDKSDLEEKYEDETLINKTYLYWESKKREDVLEWCKKCQKVEHNVSICILFKDLEYEMIYLNEVKEKEDFKLGPLMAEIYSTSKPEYKFIKTEIQRIEKTDHEISQQGITPGEAKVNAVRDFSTPKNLRAIHRFLDQQVGFKNLKKVLTTASVLAHPNNKKEYVLYTDAFHLGLGAILAQ